MSLLDANAAGRLTIPRWLAAAGRGDRPALRAGHRVLNYAELGQAVMACARHMRSLGVRAGERVVVIAPNAIEPVLALLALTSLGAVAVPLSAEAGHARLAHALEDTGATWCVADDAVQIPGGVNVLRLTELPPADAIAFEILRDEFATMSKDVAAGSMAYIRYSSGSTGVPKGVMLSHGQAMWTACMLADVFGLNGQHRELVFAPIAHSGAWQRVAATLYGGGCVIFSEGPLSVAAVLDDAAAHRATGFFTPPPLLRSLLSAPRARVREGLQSCRSIEIGSAPLVADELAAMLDLLPESRVFFHYGLTECSRAVVLDARAHADKLHTVGRPAPGVRVSLRDESGREVPSGAAGQIFLQGAQRSDGYWNRDELNHARFSEGWLATGDYGSLDEEGFLVYLGRADDLINCGGFSFFPSEAEALLGPVEGVSQYLVIGVPDPRAVLGQVPVALLVPDDAASWQAGIFLKAARQRLPAYMVPRALRVVAALPLTGSGKPDRRRAAELYSNTEG